MSVGRRNRQLRVTQPRQFPRKARPNNSVSCVSVCAIISSTNDILWLINPNKCYQLLNNPITCYGTKNKIFNPWFTLTSIIQLPFRFEHCYMILFKSILHFNSVSVLTFISLPTCMQCLPPVVTKQLFLMRWLIQNFSLW